MTVTVAAPGSAGSTPSGRRAVRLLAAARAVSFAGSYGARIALVYTLYDRTGSSTWVTAALLSEIGVLGVLGPVSGWIGDHAGRRRVMVAAEVGAALVYLLLLWADAPWVLVAGTLAATVVNSPFLPSSTAAVPNLVGEGDLRWANSMLALSSNAGLVVGPIVGGWLLAASGIHLLFAVNALSYLLSAVVILRVPGRFEEDRVRSPHREPGALRAGYRVIVRHRVIRIVTGALALTHFTFGLAMVADPALAEEFDAGSFGYAVLYTGWGLVALLGAWLAGRLHDRRHVPYAVLAGLGAVTLGCVAIAAMPTFWGKVLVGSLGGIGSGALFPLTTGLMQEHTDDAVRARVFGAVETVDKGLFAIGMVAGAPLVAGLGAEGSYGVTAVLLGVACLVMLGLPAAVAARHVTDAAGVAPATTAKLPS